MYCEKNEPWSNGECNCGDCQFMVDYILKIIEGVVKEETTNGKKLTPNQREKAIKALKEDAEQMGLVFEN